MKNFILLLSFLICELSYGSFVKELQTVMAIDPQFQAIKNSKSAAEAEANAVLRSHEFSLSSGFDLELIDPEGQTTLSNTLGASSLRSGTDLSISHQRTSGSSSNTNITVSQALGRNGFGRIHNLQVKAALMDLEAAKLTFQRDTSLYLSELISDYLTLEFDQSRLLVLEQIEKELRKLRSYIKKRVDKKVAFPSELWNIDVSIENNNIRFDDVKSDVLTHREKIQRRF